MGRIVLSEREERSISVIGSAGMGGRDISVFDLEAVA